MKEKSAEKAKKNKGIPQFNSDVGFHHLYYGFHPDDRPGSFGGPLFETVHGGIGGIV